MSLRLQSASSQYATASAVSVTYPFIIVCWAKRDSAGAAARGICNIGQSGTNNHRHGLNLNASDFIQSLTQDTVARVANSGSATTISTWEHHAAYQGASNSRRAAINGTFGSENTANTAVAAPNGTWIGCIPAISNFYDGRIAALAVYSVDDYSDAQTIVTALQTQEPLLVSPEKLRAYWRFRDDESESIAANDATLVAGATIDTEDNPPIEYQAEESSSGEQSSSAQEISSSSSSEEDETPCNLDQTIVPTVDLPEVDWRDDLILPEPILITPRPQAVVCLEGDEGASSGVVLRWLPVAGADRYLIQWADNPQVSGPTVQEAVVIGVNEYELIRYDDFRLGQTIYWRVQAANLTTGGVSPKSEVRSLTYNCGQDRFSNNQQGTGCAAFDVTLNVRGGDKMSCSDSGTYWLEASYASADNVGRPILCIRDITWSVSEDPDGGVGATVANVENSGFKVKLRTGEGSTQVIELTATVTFRDLIREECFTCTSTKEIIVDCDGSRPIIKFKLLEALPRCDNAAAVVLLESEVGQSSASASCSSECLDFGVASSASTDCCQEGDQILVYDSIGVPPLVLNSEVSHSPENSIGYALWNCNRWEVMAIGMGCNECSSSSDEEPCGAVLTLYDLRCEEGLLIRYFKIVNIYFEGGCVKSQETDWEALSQEGVCACCEDESFSSSGSTCPECIDFLEFDENSDGLSPYFTFSAEEVNESFCVDDIKRFEFTIECDALLPWGGGLGGTQVPGLLTSTRILSINGGQASTYPCVTPMLAMKFDLFSPSGDNILFSIVDSSHYLVLENGTVSGSPCSEFEPTPITLPYQVGTSEPNIYSQQVNFLVHLPMTCEEATIETPESILFRPGETFTFWVDIKFDSQIDTGSNRKEMTIAARCNVRPAYLPSPTVSFVGLQNDHFGTHTYLCSPTRCCIEGECTEATNETECTQAGGIIMGPGLCESVECPEEPTGRCCVPGDPPTCLITTESGCDALGGTWEEGEDCSGLSPCPGGA